MHLTIHTYYPPTIKFCSILPYWICLHRSRWIEKDTRGVPSGTRLDLENTVANYSGDLRMLEEIVYSLIKTEKIGNKFRTK